MSETWVQVDLFQLTSSSGGSLVKTSASPGHVEASPPEPAAGSGSTSFGSSKNSDRAALSSKTSADSLGGTWTRWRPGSTGLATRWRSPESPPLTSGRRTIGNGSGSLASMKQEIEPYGSTVHAAEISGATCTTNTPTIAIVQASKTGKSTPIVPPAKMWPTPLASDWKSQSPATQATNARPLRERIDGRLSPDWVEALMGFPPGWSDLGPEGFGQLRAERSKARGSPRGRSADRETAREGGR